MVDCCVMKFMLCDFYEVLRIGLCPFFGTVTAILSLFQVVFSDDRSYIPEYGSDSFFGLLSMNGSTDCGFYSPLSVP